MSASETILKAQHLRLEADRARRLLHGAGDDHVARRLERYARAADHAARRLEREARAQEGVLDEASLRSSATSGGNPSHQGETR